MIIDLNLANVKKLEIYSIRILSPETFSIIPNLILSLVTNNVLYYIERLQFLYCTIPPYCFVNSKTFQSSSNESRSGQASIGEAFIAVFQTPLPDIVHKRNSKRSRVSPPLSFGRFRRRERRNPIESLGSSNRSSVTRRTPEASFVHETKTSRGWMCVLLPLSFASGRTALLRLLNGTRRKICCKWKHRGTTIFECRAFFNLCNALRRALRRI